MIKNKNYPLRINIKNKRNGVKNKLKNKLTL